MKAFLFLLSVLCVLLSCSYSDPSSNYEAGFQERAKVVIDYLADHYTQNPAGYRGSNPSDFGKYNYPKIIAWFTKYDESETTGYAQTLHERMAVFSTKPTFHFNLVGLPRILYLFPDAPGVKDNEKEFLERVFERSDSYSAWTCEGTENHVNMSRTSGYLYARLALEKYPEDFPDAARRLAEMKQWLLYFSKTIYTTGTGEWNSSIYEAYNIIGWINLYDFAADPDIRKAARAVLDYYACELALHYTQAMIGGSDIRGSGQTKSFTSASDYLAWVWFGDSPREMTAEKAEKNCYQSIHAATSFYRPPEIAVRLARKELTVPAMYYNSKPGYLLEDKSLIKQTFFIGKTFTLGAGYIPYGGWTTGNWQIVSWELISRVDPGNDRSAQSVSGGGMLDVGGGHYRAPFDQFVHHENVLIQMTCVPENADQIILNMGEKVNSWRTKWEADFISRYTDQDDKMLRDANPVKFVDFSESVNQSFIYLSGNGGWLKTSIEQNIFFIELEKTFLAIRSIAGQTPTFDDSKLTDAGGGCGQLCGFILEAGSRIDFVDMSEFKQAMLDQTEPDRSRLSDKQLAYIDLSGDTIRVQYNTAGHFKEPFFDFGYGVTTPQVIHTAPPFTQPEWPSGEGHGRLATWSINGDLVDLTTEWAVYKGPHLLVKDGRLVLDDSLGNRYEVDYTGDLPVFK